MGAGDKSSSSLTPKPASSLLRQVPVVYYGLPWKSFVTQAILSLTVLLPWLTAFWDLRGTLLWVVDRLFFFKIYLLCVCEYTVTPFGHTRRGHWIPVQMVVNHCVVGRNWTLDPWKSSQCFPQPLNTLFVETFLTLTVEPITAGRLVGQQVLGIIISPHPL